LVKQDGFCAPTVDLADLAVRFGRGSDR